MTTRLFLLTLLGLVPVMLVPTWPTALIVAGVVPVLSFVMEHRAKGWFAADLPGVIARPTTTLGR